MDRLAFLLALFFCSFISVSESVDCELPWRAYGETCVREILDSELWGDGENRCQLLVDGSHLVSPDAATVAELATLVAFPRFWISLNSITDDAVMEWGSGSTVEIPADVTVEDGLCGVWDEIGGYSLVDCVGPNNFVCQMTPGVTSPWDNGVYDIDNRKYICDLQADECPPKYSTCYDIPFDDWRVCNTGTCEMWNQCDCPDDVNYSGDTCETSCFGHDGSLDESCTLNGACVGFDICDCDYGWTGHNCTMPACFGFAADNETYVCSGHGDCLEDPENAGVWVCVCDDDPEIRNETTCSYVGGYVIPPPDLLTSIIVGVIAGVVVIIVVILAVIYLVCVFRRLQAAREAKKNEEGTPDETEMHNVDDFGNAADIRVNVEGAD